MNVSLQWAIIYYLYIFLALTIVLLLIPVILSTSLYVFPSLSSPSASSICSWVNFLGLPSLKLGFWRAAIFPVWVRSAIIPLSYSAKASICRTSLTAALQSSFRWRRHDNYIYLICWESIRRKTLISLTFYKYYTKNSGKNRILGGVKFWTRKKAAIWFDYCLCIMLFSFRTLLESCLRNPSNRRRLCRHRRSRREHR